jgi:hypothetical protein
MISSTASRTMSKLSTPGLPTAMPSAIVGSTVISVGAPRFSDTGYAAALAACTPTTRTLLPSAAARCLTALATPEIRPPPPMGTTTVATSGTSSSTSRPSVPCPATTSWWSNGWMNTAPVRSANSAAASSGSCTVWPTSTTSAP